MLSLNNKARNLYFLKKKRFNVPKLDIFKSTEFINHKEKVIKKIQKIYKDKIAVRSSAYDEDNLAFSNAGKYKSFININPKKKDEIIENINKVINSYGKNKKDSIFFIQSMVKNIKLSGVVLTRDLNTFSPYYVVNFHEGSDSTLVTSGRKNTNCIKYFPNKKYKINKKFNRLIKEVTKIKEIFKSEIDVEFCINKSGKVFILQARKLNIPRKNLISLVDKKKFLQNLLSLEKKIIKLKKQQNNELGKTTYFGVMPDWNPAEIIGKKPRPLALSLYREIITDHIWSENRFNYGFKDVSQFHLMTTFFNTPFVDVKVDFNSWLPRDLNENIQKKIINFYLDKFKKNISFHDKIEKEIIFSCYSLNIEKKIKDQLGKKLKRKELNLFIKSLKKINNLSYEEKKKDYLKIQKLITKQKKIQESNLYYFDKIYWHVENCKKFGTLPFAGLARCGFIAIEIIDSFVREKVLSHKEKYDFLNSISTISTELANDYVKLNKSKFISKYGHLRPNSYEINSPNYKEGFDKYFKTKKKILVTKKKFQFSKQQKIKIKKFIKKFNKKLSFNEFLIFLKESITFREYSKFIFMKSVDLIFENIKLFAKKYRINFNDLSYLKINDLTDFYYNLSSEMASKDIQKMIKQNKEDYFKNYNLDLPDIILSPRDLFVSEVGMDNPNYITDKECYGEITELNINKKINISNKIVCIENADPGFDFIFSHKIKGLITKYGGFNSHMSIRCSELGIPAIIGVGENNYKNIINSRKIAFKCKDKSFKIL